MISIITPVYNGENFIKSCIQVVIDQKCNNIEHIIVDGNSNDKTVEIIKEYAGQYNHIKWISEEDNGQSDAMNKGIAIADGSIISILNVDDYYEPNTLNRVLEMFRQMPEPSMIVGNCNVWLSEGNLGHINKPKNLGFIDLLLGYSANPFPENPSAYFYHTSLHEKIGLYDVTEEYGMDLDFILRAVQVANVKYFNETWGNYRRFVGTKTFEALKENTCSSTTNRIIEKYQKNLPLFQRTFVNLAYKFCEAVDWSRVRYFTDDPRNVKKVLFHKFNLGLRKN